MSKPARSIRLSDETWEQLENLKARFNVSSRTKVIEILTQRALRLAAEATAPNLWTAEFDHSKIYSPGDIAIVTQDGVPIEKIVIYKKTSAKPVPKFDPVLNNELWQMVQDIDNDDFYRPYFHKGTEFTDPTSGDTWTKSNE